MRDLFDLELYNFHSNRSKLIHDLPPRPRTDARMHMWGKLLPKRGQSEWSCSAVGKEVCDLLALDDDPDVLDLVLYPYIGMDWIGCAKIQFIEDERPDDKGLFLCFDQTSYTFFSLI